jgi:hypothetical protein
MWRVEENFFMPTLETRFRPTIIVLIVVVHFGLFMLGAYVHSPTVDEPAYLASGISHWQFGRFDLCKVSPPLVRLVAAIPVMLAGPEYDWSAYQVEPGVRAEHSVGLSFRKRPVDHVGRRAQAGCQRLGSKLMRSSPAVVGRRRSASH